MRRTGVVAWALPLVLLVGMVVLTALQLNSSSVVLLGSQPKSDSNLVWGTPREIRWDEYMISTPIAVGAVAKGLPTHTWIGLNDIDLEATSLAPMRSWVTAFKPQMWGLMVADPRREGSVERGFAWHWWLTLVAGILGVYALLMAIRARPLLAGTLALMVGLAPHMAWWSGVHASDSLGFVAGAGAAAVMGLRSVRVRASVAWGLLAAWLLLVGWFALYPPWLVSVGVVVVFVVAGVAFDRRVGWRRVTRVLAATALPVVVVVGVWLTQNSAAISAIGATIYPGQRRSVGGEGSWSDLLSAPSSIFLSFNPGALSLGHGAAGNRNNLSEASSMWVSAPVLALLVVLLALSIVRRARARRRGDGVVAPSTPKPDNERWRMTAAGGVAAMAVLLAWAMLPLPAALGLGVMTRVPGFRTYLAVGLAFAMLLHVMVGRVRLPRRVLWPVALGTVVASGLVTAVSTRDLMLRTSVGLAMSVVVAVVFACLVLTLLFGGRVAQRVGAGALIALTLVSYAVVVPLYRGLGPITSTPLARYLAAAATAEGPTRWVTLDPSAQPVLAASPQYAISGMTLYPDRALWNRLAPGQDSVWNNYNEYLWAQDPSLDAAFVVPLGLRGSAEMNVSLCSPEVEFLDINYVITSKRWPAALPCFSRVGAIDDLGTTLTIWRRTPRGGATPTAAAP
ncbi:MAG: hypothetical protein F2842_10800 [Actinobacteria bacterium]|uniref:Unannotated protein n=1 Tax=freshwater metagenome TaxID=449393 RepID=A0A6J7L267_9ZZZZ|nr:hypothetical protein [Actinomycetota bacterium]